MSEGMSEIQFADPHRGVKRSEEELVRLNHSVLIKDFRRTKRRLALFPKESGPDQ